MDVWLEGKGSEGKSECSRVEIKSAPHSMSQSPGTRVEDLLFSRKTLRYLRMVQHMCIGNGCGALIKLNLERV